MKRSHNFLTTLEKCVTLVLILVILISAIEAAQNKKPGTTPGTVPTKSRSMVRKISDDGKR